MANKRVYNEDRTSYEDYNSEGKWVGSGVAGTENLSTNGSGMTNSTSDTGESSALRDAITGKSSSGGTGVTSAPRVTNNTSLINKQTDAALQSTIESIRAAVQQAKLKQQKIITDTPGQYNNLKNVVYNQALASLPAMRENTANLGASTEGGYSRTTETAANSQLQNRLGELDRQKQSVIDQANEAIADLEAKGLYEEANATKESALSRLQMIVAESSRLDSLNSSNFWNAQNYGLEKSGQDLQRAGQEQSQSNWLREYNSTEDQRAWENAYNLKNFEADQAYKAAALARSGNGGSGGSASKESLLAEAYNDINTALYGGSDPDIVKQNILAHSGEYTEMGISVPTLISQVDKIVTSWGKNEDGEVNANPAIAERTARIDTPENQAMAAWYSLNKMWGR